MASFKHTSGLGVKGSMKNEVGVEHLPVFSAVVALAVSADPALIWGSYGFALKLNVLAYTLFSSLAIQKGWYPDIRHWTHLGGIFVLVLLIIFWRWMEWHQILASEEDRLGYEW